MPRSSIEEKSRSFFFSRYLVAEVESHYCMTLLLQKTFKKKNCDMGRRNFYLFTFMHVRYTKISNSALSDFICYLSRRGVQPSFSSQNVTHIHTKDCRNICLLVQRVNFHIWDLQNKIFLALYYVNFLS